ncbi:MAG: polysaccharide biosynthesis C-terminal domain-containing protein, partial [Candidatus Thermoplasmatota archaeon]|nr:polysaccharide biosynthesis C-terminal domain-containing protein [Candidatus Thermoplasmatota archaeon]
RITIYYKINKSLPYIILLGFPGLLLLQLIILKLFGGKYPIDIQLLLFFSIGGILILITGFYTWLMNSIGKKGIKITTIGGIICAITNISLNFILIPLIGILGSIISTIISFLIFLFIISRSKYYL